MFLNHAFTFRTFLAALHYNENAGRPQAVTKDGELVWVIKFPKAKKGAVVAPHKTGCTYGICQCSFIHNWCRFLNVFESLVTEYVGELMAAVLDLCKTMPSYAAAIELHSQDAPPFLSSAYECADKQALVQQHQSRFNR